MSLYESDISTKVRQPTSQSSFPIPCHAQAVLVCLSVLNIQLKEKQKHTSENEPIVEQFSIEDANIQAQTQTHSDSATNTTLWIG